MKKERNPVKKLNAETEIVQQFLDVIADTLRKSVGMGLQSFEGEEHDICLCFKMYDEELLNIGYADENDKIYLLDSDFIYKRLQTWQGKSTYCNKLEFFNMMLELGAVKTYQYAKKSPLFELLFEKNTEKPYCRECFCVPMDIIDYDISLLRVF